MVKSLSHVQLFLAPWTAAHQDPLSSTNFRSLLNFTPIASVMLSNHVLWPKQLPRGGDRTPASVPPPAEGRSSPNTPDSPLVPSACRVLCGSIYSFSVVRYSCPLSAGVLNALLCLKVYSWCTRRERCPPRPPTPLPSCSPVWIFKRISKTRKLENWNVCEISVFPVLYYISVPIYIFKCLIN